MLRIQPLRVQRDEAIYECTATNSLGEINTSAKLSVLEGMSWGDMAWWPSRLRCGRNPAGLAFLGWVRISAQQAKISGLC